MTERRETGKVDQNSMARNSLTTLAHDFSATTTGTEVMHEKEKEREDRTLNGSRCYMHIPCSQPFEG